MSNVTNVAVESGFYEFTADDGKDQPRFRGALSDIEGAMISALRRVDEEMRAPPRDHPNAGAIVAGSPCNLRERQRCANASCSRST